MRTLVLFKIIVLLVSIGLQASCGSSVDPVSQAKGAVSDSGAMLIAVRGDKQGICVMQSSLNDPTATLVTREGALSNKQLKRVVAFMPYDKQISTAALGVLGIAWGFITADNAMRLRDDLQLVWGAVIVTTAIVGGMAYRVHHGIKEGEKPLPIVVQGILHGIIGAPEHFQREGRFRKVLSNKEEWTVTDKKMGKMIKRMARLEPAYPGECDYLDLDKPIDEVVLYKSRS